MLHQSYFESRNALIHYIILRKKDMYSFVYSHVEKSISLNTNAVLYLETFFFLDKQPVYTLLLNFLGFDLCHFNMVLVLPCYISKTT